jgi:large subunit ribosomal protein L18
MSITRLKHKKPRGKGARRQMARRRRHARVLKKIRGTSERPRLVVHRSLRHIEAQLVDDVEGVCIAGISTRGKELRSKLTEENRTKTAESRLAGRVMAERAREKGVATVVFDRGGYVYHGRVRAFAEGAREGGLEF